MESVLYCESNPLKNNVMFYGEIVPQYEFSVSLKIVHPSMPASVMSDKLTMEPEICSNAGANRVSRNGRSLGGTYESSIWSSSLTEGKVDAEDILFDEFITKQNSKLSTHQKFFNEVRKAGGSVEYFVGWFSSGSINMNIVLSPELMKKTSELGVTIVMCAYPDDEEK